MKSSRNIVYLAGAIVLSALAYIVFRLCHFGAPPAPAIITPAMDAHRLLASALDARVYRLAAARRPVVSAKHARLIALTFDDGPYALYTPLLLDELNDLHVTATFFLIGRDAQEQPEITRRIVDEHFEVVDHTMTHPDRFDLLPPARVEQELRDGTKALREFTNARTIADEWRPPHGRYSEETIKIAQRLGYTTILWTDDPGDFRADSTPQMLAAHVEKYATDPDILLLHSGVIATIEMLPAVVQAFRAHGFTFVRVSDLMRSTSPEALNHPEHTPLDKPLPG